MERFTKEGIPFVKKIFRKNAKMRKQHVHLL